MALYRLMVSVVTGLVLDLLDPLDHTVLQLIFGEVVCASAMTVSPTSRRAATPRRARTPDRSLGAPPATA